MKNDFDALIRKGDDAGALLMLADELYKGGKIGGTRKELLLRAAGKLREIPSLQCLFCCEAYTVADIAELREMGETFYREGELFICPDCFDDWSRLDAEERQKALAQGKDYEWRGDE